MLESVLIGHKPYDSVIIVTVFLYNLRLFAFLYRDSGHLKIRRLCGTFYYPPLVYGRVQEWVCAFFL